MSAKSNMDQIDVKKIKIEDKHEKLGSFGATSKNPVVDCFKNKCMDFVKNQLDHKKLRTKYTFKNTGKIIKTSF